MELNFFENFKRKTDLSTDDAELELAKKLDAIQEFSVDRIEENQIVLENRKTKEMVNIEKDKLPSDIREGDILKCINGKYILDNERTRNESERIRDKMNKLWGVIIK